MRVPTNAARALRVRDLLLGGLERSSDFVEAVLGGGAFLWLVSALHAHVVDEGPPAPLLDAAFLRDEPFLLLPHVDLAAEDAQCRLDAEVRLELLTAAGAVEGGAHEEGVVLVDREGTGGVARLAVGP